MAHQPPMRNDLLPRGSAIPDKLYFRIGEVALLCEVPTYVLRFWESEFPQLKPNKGGTGQRLFRRRDVEMALRIKCLLYDEGYTIPGARQLLKGEQRQKEPQLPLPSTDIDPDLEGLQHAPGTHLQQLREELEQILAIVSRAPRTAAPRTAAPGPARSQRPVNAEPATESLFDVAQGHDTRASNREE